MRAAFFAALEIAVQSPANCGDPFRQRAVSAQEPAPGADMRRRMMCSYKDRGDT
jgi:hypothetical protein